jgi:uncharacterized membrane protein YhhN
VIGTRLLAAATLLSAALAIAAAPWALDQPVLAYVFKPLATVLVIVFAWGRGRASPGAVAGRQPGVRPIVRRWIIAGLVLSLVGDVALLWPREGFLPGLVSFLLAHGAYLWAFTRVRRFAALALPFVAYAAVAGGILALLWPGVPAALRLPVLLYVLALASMAAQAAVLWRLREPRGAVLAAGGALFVLSDALLAINRFSTPLPMASLWILASYWSAQWCIAAWLAPRAGDTPPGAR